MCINKGLTGCWGCAHDGYKGQCNVPFEFFNGADSIATGLSHTCLGNASLVACVGDNTYG